MWKYYAILSAVFAALTAIFAKIGIESIDSDAVTSIRTCVVLLIPWGIVIIRNSTGGLKDLTSKKMIYNNPVILNS